MKKIIAICLCIAACLAFSACDKNASDITVPHGMQLASDTEIPDYTLFVPTAWTVDIQTGTTAAYLKDPLGNILATFTASFTQNKDSGTTLDNYFESYKAEFESVFGGIDKAKLEETDITLDEVKAKQYIYDASFGGVDYKFRQVVCFREGRIYTLTYSATEKLYESNVNDMSLIIDNFKFTK